MNYMIRFVYLFMHMCDSVDRFTCAYMLWRPEKGTWSGAGVISEHEQAHLGARNGTVVLCKSSGCPC